MLLESVLSALLVRDKILAAAPQTAPNKAKNINIVHKLDNVASFPPAVIIRNNIIAKIRPAIEAIIGLFKSSLSKTIKDGKPKTRQAQRPINNAKNDIDKAAFGYVSHDGKCPSLNSTTNGHNSGEKTAGNKPESKLAFSISIYLPSMTP